MASGRGTDFFISYTRHDVASAEWIAWTLESAGYSVVLDTWDVRPGENFVRQLDAALADARQIVIVLSQDYANRGFTQSEWEAGLLREALVRAPAQSETPGGRILRLLPIRVEPVQLSGILGALVYLDLVGLSPSAAKESLLSAVSHATGRPSRPPAFPGGRRDAKLARVPGEYTLMEVFKQSGTPTVTFVEPTDFYLLKLALEHPGRGIVIEGPSGIGKTSALRRAMERPPRDPATPDIELLTARDPDHVDRIGKLRAWHRGITARGK